MQHVIRPLILGYGGINFLNVYHDFADLFSTPFDFKLHTKVLVLRCPLYTHKTNLCGKQGRITCINLCGGKSL